MAGHPVVHIEFAAKDPKKLSEFYAEAFGWKMEEMPQFDYVSFEGKPGPGGGFPRIDGNMYRSGDVVVNVETDDIDASLKQIEKLGGKLVHAKREIPGQGWFAFFQDPSGNRVALFTGIAPSGQS